jgi:hypothetical protein
VYRDWRITEQLTETPKGKHDPMKTMKAKQKNRPETKEERIKREHPGISEEELERRLFDVPDDCQHARGEDCMTCIKCGKCRETLDDADVCDGCRARA